MTDDSGYLPIQTDEEWIRVMAEVVASVIMFAEPVRDAVERGVLAPENSLVNAVKEMWNHNNLNTDYRRGVMVAMLILSASGHPDLDGIKVDLIRLSNYSGLTSPTSQSRLH